MSREKNMARSQKIKSTLKNLSIYIVSDKLLFLTTVLLGIGLGVLQLLMPLLIANILDGFSTDVLQQKNKILWLAVVYVFALLLSIILGFNVSKLSKRVSNSIRQRAFFHLTRLPMNFFDTVEQGDIISRMTNDVQAIAIGLQQVFQQLFSGIVVLLGAIILMYSMHPIVASLVVFLTPFSILLTRKIAFGSNDLFSQQSKIVGKLQSHAEEMLSGQKIVRAFGAEEKSQMKFDEINAELYVVGQKAQFISSLTNPSTRLVNNITYVLVGVVSSALAALGQLTIGEISAFLNYALQYAKPVNEISQVLTQIQNALASAERIFELLDHETEADESVKTNLEFLAGEVKFDSLSFRYLEDKPLIEDFTINIKAGQTVAIVGPTGAGKTTLVNLLMRFYEPRSGAIYLDKENIADVKKDSVRDVYGMVLQDTWLLQASVFDNIAYGKANASEAEVYEAAKNAQAHDFILQLENGYDTKLQDAGDSLSTGQKQLLTIARVFISEPDMLILDEATSDIDTRTEILVQEAFAKLMEGKTSFIIAHRLSTIKDADLIIVMNKGNIIETGTHEELLAKRGFYWNLHNSQFSE